MARQRRWRKKKGSSGSSSSDREPAVVEMTFDYPESRGEGAPRVIDAPPEPPAPPPLPPPSAETGTPDLFSVEPAPGQRPVRPRRELNVQPETVPLDDACWDEVPEDLEPEPLDDGEPRVTAVSPPARSVGGAAPRTGASDAGAPGETAELPFVPPPEPPDPLDLPVVDGPPQPPPDSVDALRDVLGGHLDGPAADYLEPISPAPIAGSPGAENPVPENPVPGDADPAGEEAGWRDEETALETGGALAAGDAAAAAGGEDPVDPDRPDTVTYLRRHLGAEAGGASGADEEGREHDAPAAADGWAVGDGASDEEAWQEDGWEDDEAADEAGAPYAEGRDAGEDDLEGDDLEHGDLDDDWESDRIDAAGTGTGPDDEGLAPVAADAPPPGPPLPAGSPGPAAVRPVPSTRELDAALGAAALDRAALADAAAQRERREVFVDRGKALAIDVAALAGAAALAGVGAVAVSGGEGLAALGSGGGWLALADALARLVYVLSAVYFTSFHALDGRTPGKALLGLRVEAVDGPAGAAPGWGPSFARWFVATMTALPLGAGLLYALREPAGRAAHDLAAGTRVVRTDGEDGPDEEAPPRVDPVDVLVVEADDLEPDEL